jgi:hypothetical protein
MHWNGDCNFNNCERESVDAGGLCKTHKKETTMNNETRYTKREYEAWLNDLPVDWSDCKSNGGRIPDDANYGTWLRRNDPIAFQVGFNERRDAQT